ncbi:hypothetical protein SAMN04488040_1396 [Sulfitobacter marinus]|uniref:Lipoprotein n=1 Tax=Sulfitobacter marinus TaxID=394264 RepID=A0A1I6RQ67_9RHOB|nr:hypothetical protein [Sulfitobacter marinus]SFS66832.1 hypothetical protein SAMN04488040_1396 [Sulfitobacter marinus]
MKVFRTKIILATACAFGLTACADISDVFGKSADKTYDGGFDRKHLSQLKAGIWVDPNGCDHWIIDDGVEGYLSARIDKYGKPVCSGVAAPTYTAGDFKTGSTIGDPN